MLKLPPPPTQEPHDTVNQIPPPLVGPFVQKLRVNHDFKKQFEEKERRRELSYLDSKGLLDGSDGSESSDESSDDDEAVEANTGHLDSVLSTCS